MATKGPSSGSKRPAQRQEDKGVPETRVEDGAIKPEDLPKILGSTLLASFVEKMGKWVKGGQGGEPDGNDADGAQITSTADASEIRDGSTAEPSELERVIDEAQKQGEGKKVDFAIPAQLTNADTNETATFITTEYGVQVMRDTYGDPINDHPPTFRARPITEEQYQKFAQATKQSRWASGTPVSDGRGNSTGSPNTRSSGYSDYDHTKEYGETHTGLHIAANVAATALDFASMGMLGPVGHFLASRIASKQGRHSIVGDTLGAVLGAVGTPGARTAGNTVSKSINNMFRERDKKKSQARAATAEKAPAAPASKISVGDGAATQALEQEETPSGGGTSTPSAEPSNSTTLGVSAAQRTLNNIKSLEGIGAGLELLDKNSQIRHAEQVKILKKGFHLDEFADFNDFTKKKDDGKGGWLSTLTSWLGNSFLGKLLKKIPGVGILAKFLKGFAGLGLLGGMKHLAGGIAGLTKSIGGLGGKILKPVGKLLTKIPVVGGALAKAGGIVQNLATKILPGAVRTAGKGAASIVENGLASSGKAGAAISRAGAGAAGTLAAEGAGVAAKGVLSNALGAAGQFAKVAGPITGLISGGLKYLDIKDRKDLSGGQKAVQVAGSAGGAVAGGAIGAAFGSIVPVVGTIVGGAVGSWLGEKFGGKIGQFLSDNYQPIKNAISGVQKVLTTATTGIAKTTWTAAKGSAKLLGKAAKAVFDYSPVGILSKLVGSEIEKISPVVSETFHKVTSFVSDKVTSLYTSAKESFTSFLKDPIKSLTDVAKAIPGKMLDGVTGVVKSVFGKDVADKFHATVTKVFTDLKDGFLKKSGEILDSIGGFFKGVGEKIGKIKDGVVAGVKKAREVTKPYTKPLEDGAKKATKAIGGAATWMADKVKGASSAVVDTASRAYKSVKNDIKEDLVDPTVKQAKETVDATGKAVEDLKVVANSAAPVAAPVAAATMGGGGASAPQSTPTGAPSSPPRQHRDNVTTTGSDKTPVTHSKGLGYISAKYESGGRGAAAISNDTSGGHAYGTHQLYSGKNDQGGTLQEYLKQSKYGEQFKGLRPGSAEFNAKWKQIAGADANFGNDQHDFITKTHYDPVARAAKAMGINVDKSRAIQEALYSMGVQQGAGGAKVGAIGSLNKAFQGVDVSKLSEQQIIDRLYQYKAQSVDRNFSTAIRENPNVRGQQLGRIDREKKDVYRELGVVPTAENTKTSSVAVPSTPIKADTVDARNVIGEQPAGAPVLDPNETDYDKIMAGRKAAGDAPSSSASVKGTMILNTHRAGTRNQYAAARANTNTSNYGGEVHNITVNQVASPSQPVTAAQMVAPSHDDKIAAMHTPPPPTQEGAGAAGAFNGGGLPTLSDIPISPLDPSLLKLNTGGFER